ncbi:MAG: adenylyltransferase/cytidyltransferase family protein [Cyanobacteria bacterium P01_H01_bin.74]
MGIVCSEETLLNRLKAGRAETPETTSPVVLTNGCFDLLHVGHVKYLQACRAFGKTLVVLVNSDNSVSRLKGPKRPVNAENDRAEVIAALACVDYVTLFDADSPMALIQRIGPDIYVKGDQYNESNLPEMPVLTDLGTAVRFVPMVENISTTTLIEKILAAEKHAAV